MLWTLQSYISRELGKTFLLTAIGLIAVIGLGGGVRNMIELEGVSALQLLKLMALILPVAATLTLPIAALYSATVTYGRLSADNELNACRSSGINIHVLFLPTLVISTVSAVCCFFFINFMIPIMVRNLDQFLEADIPRLVKQKLVTSDRFSIRDKFVIYADSTTLEENEAGQPVLRLNGVAFTEMDDGDWKKFGTARTVQIAFTRRDGLPVLSARMFDSSVYDAQRRSFADFAEQEGGAAIPQRLPIKIKWLTLGGLLEYRKRPETYPAIGEELNGLRGGIARRLLFNMSADVFPKTGEVRIADADHALTISSQNCQLDKERRPRFIDDVMISEVLADGTTRTIRADSATLDMRRERRLEDVVIDVEATGNVSIEDSRDRGSIQRRDREKFDPVALSPQIVEQARAYDANVLLDPNSGSLRLGEWVDQRRAHVIEGVARVSRDVTAELHARLAFSVSVFVLVILGAALGIVFRGSQVLVAFGISFVPSVLVISTIIMGKQLIEKPGTTLTGIGVMWAGIALVALVDGFVLTKVVRR